MSQTIPQSRLRFDPIQTLKVTQATLNLTIAHACYARAHLEFALERRVFEHAGDMHALVEEERDHERVHEQSERAHEDENKVVPHAGAEYAQLTNGRDDHQVIAAQIHVRAGEYEHEEYAETVHADLFSI